MDISTITGKFVPGLGPMILPILLFKHDLVLCPHGVAQTHHPHHVLLRSLHLCIAALCVPPLQREAEGLIQRAPENHPRTQLHLQS